MRDVVDGTGSGSRFTRAPAWALAAIVATCAIAAADVLLRHRLILIGLLIVGPLLAARTSRPVWTAGLSLWALALAFVLGAVNDIFGTADHFVRIAVVLVGGLLATDRARASAQQQELRRQAEAMAERTLRLQAVTADLSRALSPEEIANVILDEGIGALGGAAGAIMLLTDDQSVFTVVGSRGYTAEGMQQWSRFPMDEGLPAGDCVLRREPVLISSLGEWKERYPVLYSQLNPEFEAMAAIPMLTDDRPLGAMALSFRGDRHFSQEDASLMMSLARQSALGFQRSLSYERERLARAEAEEAGDRLAFLSEVSRVLASSLDYDETLRAVTRLAVPRLGDWCILLVFDESGHAQPLMAAHADQKKAAMVEDYARQQGYDPDRELGMARVARTGQPAFYPEIGEDLLRVAARDEEQFRVLQELGLRSGISLPLPARGRVVGVLTLATAESGRIYTRDDLDFAEHLARRAGAAIDNAILYRHQAAASRTLQRSLLPPELPTVPGLAVAARYRPIGVSDVVGGDFYDIFSLPNDHWGVVIGDVCGKGVEAAAFTALVRYTLRTLAERDPQPTAVVSQLNRLVLRHAGPDRFSTLIYACVAPHGGGAHVRLSCAGHPPPWLLRAEGTAEEVASFGPALGLEPEVKVTEAVLDLQPDDVLLLYTDGLSEARGPQGFFGEVALEPLLASVEARSPEQVLALVQVALEEFEAGRSPQDDLAMVAFSPAPG